MTRGRPPAWAWVLLAWAALVAAGALLERFGGLALETCLFRRVSGVPCPTCGSTRAVLALLRGDPLGSLRASPLLWLAGLLFMAVLAWRLRSGAFPRLEKPWQRRGALALGLAALLLNWAWVWRQGL